MRSSEVSTISSLFGRRCYVFGLTRESHIHVEFQQHSLSLLDVSLDDERWFMVGKHVPDWLDLTRGVCLVDMKYISVSDKMLRVQQRNGCDNVAFHGYADGVATMMFRMWCGMWHKMRQITANHQASLRHLHTWHVAFLLSHDSAPRIA